MGRMPERPSFPRPLSIKALPLLASMKRFICMKEAAFLFQFIYLLNYSQRDDKNK
jgi:hypothetical protein